MPVWLKIIATLKKTCNSRLNVWTLLSSEVIYLHLNKNKRSLVSVRKESCNNLRSSLMKKLDRGVETLGLES